MAYVNWGLNDVQSWNGVSESIPPAPDYVLRITAAEQGQSSKGNPQLQVSFEVVDGALAGRKVNNWYSGADRARGRVKNLLEAAGIPLDQRGGFDDQGLIGRVILADAVANTYEKADPVTGQTVSKTNIRLENERPYGAAQAQPQAQGFVAAPAPQPGYGAPPQQQMYQPPAPPAPQAGRPNFPPNAQRGAPGLTPVR